MLNEEKNIQIQEALIDAFRKRIEFWERLQKFWSEHKDDVVYEEKFVECQLCEHRIQLKMFLKSLERTV